MAGAVNIGAVEQKSIARALIDWFNTSCTELPTGLIMEFQCLSDSSSISLFPNKGAIVAEQYVDGGYMGYYPFSIYYRTLPDSTDTRLVSNDIVDSIGVWVADIEENEIELPFVSDKIQITEIKQITNSSLAHRYEDGTEDYMATFDLYYESEV